MNFARHVGRNISRARQAAGLTKAELADRAGIHWTVPVAYEGGNGITDPRSVREDRVGARRAACPPGPEWTRWRGDDPVLHGRPSKVVGKAKDGRVPSSKR